MKTTHVWSLGAAAVASLILGTTVFAQERIQVGVYAGASLPTGTFKDQADLGYHAGAFGTFKVTPQFGIRLDGAYNDFGTKNFAIAQATASSKTALAFATLNAQYDLGEETVMAPGGGALPYISGGVGAYRFSFDDACTGTGCSGITFGASSETPLSRVFAYSASKAAVLNLTRNLARELAPHQVRVNALCPGFFPAEQNRAILDAQRKEDVLRHTPMKRFGDPEELIGAALLLLAPAAGSFITGTTLYVDGGFTAMTI